MRVARLTLVGLALSASLLPIRVEADTRELVPDAATALTIARAALMAAYGAKTIAAEEPLSARRDGDTWIVEGTLSCPKTAAYLGGVAEIQISSKDAEITSISHSQ